MQIANSNLTVSSNFLLIEDMDNKYLPSLEASAVSGGMKRKRGLAKGTKKT